MFFQIAEFNFALIGQIASYVLYGTIALGAIILLVLAIFVGKRLKYNKQMRHNKKEKEKIIKAYDQKINQLEQLENQSQQNKA